MESSQTIKSSVSKGLRDKAKPSCYSRLEQLTLACRMLAAEGHWSNGLAGQVTARGEAPDTYYTLEFGTGADEAVPASFILVDADLNPLDDIGLPNPATRFHIWVYRTHPEVGCIVHTHPPATTALAMTGQELVVASMDSTPFYKNCAYLRDWPGLPITNDEGSIISKALGNNKSLLLAHHGLLTAGASVAEAATLAIWMEQAAAAQVRAAAAGTIRPVPGHLAEESRDFLLKPEIINLTFEYFARRALRQDPSCLT